MTPTWRSASTRRGPRAPILAVAVLDLDRHARRGGGRAVALAAQDPDPAQPLGAALADQPAARRLHQRRVEAFARPGDQLRVRGHRLADLDVVRGERRAGIAGGERLGVGEDRERAGDLAQRERVGEDAAAVDARPDARGIDRERGADGLADRGLRRVVVLPVRLELPAAELGQQDEHAVLPGAHVAQRPTAARRRAPAGRPSGRRAASPRMPHASTDCAIPSRRNSAWTVRTWTSSPEWLDVMIASSSPVRSNSRRPPARSSGDQRRTASSPIAG